MASKDPRNDTFNLNGKDEPFHALPQKLQAHLLLAYDFYNKLDDARSHEERDRLLKTHPFNQ